MSKKDKKQKTEKVAKQKKEKRNKRRLGTVIIVATLICTILSNVALAVCSYKIAEKELGNSAYSTLYNIIDAVALDVNSINEKYYAALESLSQVTIFRDENNTLRQKTDWLNAISAVNKLFMNMMFIGKDGKAIDEVGNIRDDSAAPYFVKSMEGKRVVQDPTLYGDQMLVIYSVPVYGLNNEIAGILAGIVDAKVLTDSVESISVGNGNHPFLINMTNGVVVADVAYDNVKRNANVVKNTTGKMHDLFSCKSVRAVRKRVSSKRTRASSRIKGAWGASSADTASRTARYSWSAVPSLRQWGARRMFSVSAAVSTQRLSVRVRRL